MRFECQFSLSKREMSIGVGTFTRKDSNYWRTFPLFCNF